MNRSRTRLFFLGVLPVFLPTLGCQESESIREYAAPRDAVGPALVAKKAAAVPTRILAAIIPRKEHVWFVKLMGPVAQLEKQGDAFLQLVQSLKFDNPEKPTFAVPAGWARDDSNANRYSTLKLPADLGPLEATIIALGPQAGSNLENVNRWRGQIGLGPITEAELPTSTKEIEVAGVKAVVLDATGPGGAGAGPMGMMPRGAGPMQAGAGAAGSAKAGGVKAGADASAAKNPIEFKIPGSWKEIPAKPLTSKTYQTADNQVEITITALSKNAGGLAANINRWRNQIGLGPVDLAKSGTEMQPVETPSGNAIVVDFAGEGADAKRIIAATISQDTQTWFVKMMGPAQATAKEKEAFLGALQTLQLPK